MLQIDRGTPAAFRHLIYALHDVVRIARAVALAPRSRSSWGRLLNLRCFGVVISERVYRSGSPRTAAHFQHVLELGIKTVICVRRGGPSRELREFAASHQIELRMHDLVAHEGHCDLNAASRAAKAALDHSAQPVLVCCDGGRHHAGMVVALLRLETGQSLEQALSEYYSCAAPSPYEDNVLFIVRAAQRLQLG